MGSESSIVVVLVFAVAGAVVVRSQGFGVSGLGFRVSDTIVAAMHLGV